MKSRVLRNKKRGLGKYENDLFMSGSIFDNFCFGE